MGVDLGLMGRRISVLTATPTKVNAFAQTVHSDLPCVRFPGEIPILSGMRQSVQAQGSSGSGNRQDNKAPMS